MKAIIYCRVSTKDQANHGFSLVSQERECIKFAQNNGYKVVKKFIEEGESAKTLNRPQMQEMIKYCANNYKVIDAVISWKLDRLTRSLTDYATLSFSFNKMKIDILSATETNGNTASDKFLRNILGSAAQYENDIKSERTIQGMKQATREGYWCFPAPIGYKFVKSESGRSLLEPKEESEYIKQAFELAEKGIYKQTEIVQKLKDKGFNKIKSINHIRRVLRNPLYAGLLKVSWFDEYYEGNHPALISKAVFHKVQSILDGKCTNGIPHNKRNPDFPLTGILRCAKCESKFKGYWATGRNKKYPYYECRQKGCKNLKGREMVEDQFILLLQNLEPEEDILQLFEKVLLDVWRSQKKNNTDEKTSLKRERNQLEEKQNRIEELVINGTFDNATYKKRKQKVIDDIMIKEIRINELNTESNDVSGMLKYCKYFMSNLSELWINADITLKQRLQKLIFPEGILFDGKKVRTAVTNIVFGCLHDINTQKYNLASPRGIEPLLQE